MFFIYRIVISMFFFILNEWKVIEVRDCLLVKVNLDECEVIVNVKGWYSWDCIE